MTKKRNRRRRTPEGTVRPRKIARAKKEMFRLVDDPVAIALVADALLDELYPDNPLRERRLKLAS